MLSVTHETMLAELKSSKLIMDAWIQKIEEGIPGIDIPAPPDKLEDFMRSFCGELLIVSGKCENLSNVLTGDT